MRGWWSSASCRAADWRKKRNCAPPVTRDWKHRHGPPHVASITSARRLGDYVEPRRGDCGVEDRGKSMRIIDDRTSHDIAGIQHDRRILRRDYRGSRRPRDVSPDYPWPRAVGTLDTKDTPPSPAPARIRARLESAPPRCKPSHDRLWK